VKARRPAERIYAEGKVGTFTEAGCCATTHQPLPKQPVAEHSRRAESTSTIQTERQPPLQLSTAFRRQPGQPSRRGGFDLTAVFPHRTISRPTGRALLRVIADGSTGKSMSTEEKAIACQISGRQSQPSESECSFHLGTG